MAQVELRAIGPYIITRLLSEGSSSSLYLGKHQQRKKDVIIKVLNAPLTTNEAKEAFLTRAKSLKKLTHRNIAEVQDFGCIDDTGYLVMQYVSGGTIHERFVPGQSYAPDEVKRVVSPLADALHYAHVTGVLHGNLHPGNLLLSERNDILLTGFSLSLSEALPSFDDTTAALPYKSPEYLRGTLLAASDQYSLAVLAYEWLCGRRPYEATDRETLLHQQEHEPIPSPSSLNTAISANVESVLLRALAPIPEERFPHTQTFADAYLRALMGLPLPAEPKRDNGNPVGAGEDVAERRGPSGWREGRAWEALQGRMSGAKGRPGEAHLNASPATAASTGSTPASMTNNNVGAQFIAPALPQEEFITLAPPEPITPLTNGISRLHNIVTADLCQGGILSQSLPGYEERPAQVEMAAIVARSLTESKQAVVEASTGTGKSLAYLIPIVRSNKIAIISTANKALQEQLFYKDIPFVKKNIKPFEAALVKGMGNYVCLDRLENERIGIQYYAKNRDFMRLLDITSDPDSDFTGDFETLGFPLPGDIRIHVNADSDQCAWGKCNFYAECYVRKMKVKAANAQVIVVNHTLLLLDALVEGWLLPERDVIVIDEAHHLEEEATRVFTITISQGQISSLLSQRMLKDHSSVALQDEASKAMVDAWRRLEQVADPGYKNRANLYEPLEEGLHLASIISGLADSLRKQRPKDMPEKESQLYDKLLKRTTNLAEGIRTVFSVSQPGKFVYYAERVNTPGRRGRLLEVSAAPLDVTEWLRKQLFDKCNVICTSATLATIGPNPADPDDRGPNFAYFRRRTGLDFNQYPDVLERILPLTFDYEHNALLYVPLPRAVPEPVYGPGSIGYMKAIAREMQRLVNASRGRAFLLFSSKRMLEDVYQEIAGQLDFPILRQGDLPRMELMRIFRETEGAVLFGLKSFWEGVDIAGEALSLVVIDKLPFDPPDDPVHEARVAQMKAAGENWFGTYVLPQAVLRLKQGLGRLLRTREDRGVMAILDSRLYSKGYGRLVLNALPPARRTSNLRDVEEFFAEKEVPF